MSAACILFALGATVFVEEHLPGLRLGPTDPLSGLVSGNFRRADIDQDGYTDLILPDRIALQTEGRFPAASTHPLPPFEPGSTGDFWGGGLYLRTPSLLKGFRWVSGGWRPTLLQPLEPGTILKPVDQPADPLLDPTGVRFAHFLHDFDGDGLPELFFPTEAGLQLFTIVNGIVARSALLDIYPEPVLAEGLERPIWPAESRRVLWPRERMSCRFFLQDRRVTVVDQRGLGGHQTEFHVSRYSIDLARDPVLSLLSMEKTPGLPQFFRPCWLNGDDRLDFAGGDWSFSATSPLPLPIFETAVTIDGGQTLQRIRSRSFRPHCSFVDFDGDGDRDLIAESTGLFDGGIKESLSRFLSESTVRHELRVYFQDALGRFSSRPDIQHTFTITLDGPPYRSRSLYARYQSGALLNVTGDFNKDGYRDVIVQDRPNRLGLYINNRNRFARNPEATLPIEPQWRFGVADLDGDRRADIVLSWTTQRGGERMEESTVYLSREEER